jgi:hypothetical protein
MDDRLRSGDSARLNCQFEHGNRGENLRTSPKIARVLIWKRMELPRHTGGCGFAGPVVGAPVKA